MFIQWLPTALPIKCKRVLQIWVLSTNSISPLAPLGPILSNLHKSWNSDFCPSHKLHPCSGLSALHLCVVSHPSFRAVDQGVLRHMVLAYHSTIVCCNYCLTFLTCPADCKLPDFILITRQSLEQKVLDKHTLGEHTTHRRQRVSLMRSKVLRFVVNTVIIHLSSFLSAFFKSC